MQEPFAEPRCKTKLDLTVLLEGLGLQTWYLIRCVYSLKGMPLRLFIGGNYVIDPSMLCLSLPVQRMS